MNSENKKNRKKFKLPSSMTIILLVLLFVVILTWIPHEGWMEQKVLISGNDFLDQELSYRNVLFNLIAQNTFLFENGDYVLKYGNDLDSLTQFSFNSFDELNSIIKSSNVLIVTDISGNSILKINSNLQEIEYLNSLVGPDEWFNFGDGSWFISESGKYGILDIPVVFLAGIFQSYDVILYIFAIGSTIEILIHTKTLESTVSSIIKRLKNKQIILIPILFLLFALGGTLFGMQEETLGLIPVIVPFLVISGFDTVTGFFVIVFGTTTGIASSVLDPFSVGVMASSLGTSISSGVAFRLVLFIIYTSIGATFVTLYALRVQKNNEKSIIENDWEKNKEWATNHIGDIDSAKTLDKKQKIAISIFGFTFLWMIFSLLPWTSWIPSLGDNEGWILFSQLFFRNIIFGEWYFTQFIVLFSLSTIIIGKMFNYDFKKIFTFFKIAAKNLIGVAFIIVISRTISIVLEYSGLTIWMVNSLFTSLSNLNSFALLSILFLLFLLMALFIPSTSGLAGITGPIIGGLIAKEPADEKEFLMIGILLIYPLAQGVINMFSPTTGLIVVQAEESKVNFAKALPWLFGYASLIAVVGFGSIMGLLAVL